ncbi:MttB9 [Desulfamplus magnetovallimortis]|uniref:MttB9 n=1 Tax=Desulfamplus magnetovallimortis TaxID=1246637 RepID=A0A1W1H795_9BACT|nr:trimethylamine methyltransferase family protein [Desulfamplus magnetovallimortis]SLM28360.1 MttB9 [Desulfamplus magnetovallimortis]
MERPELINPSVCLKILNENELDQVYEAAITVLEKTGFKMTHKDAVALCQKSGCKIEGDRIRVPREVIEQCIETAPKGFTVYDRLGNPALDLSGRNSYYGCSTGSPHTRDYETGEIRPTTYRDLEIGAHLSDALPNIDWVMPFGTTQDTPQDASFLYDFEACVKNTTMPVMFLSESVKDSFYIQSMAAACVGGKDALREKPFLMAYPEPITPLFYPDEVVSRSLLAADWGLPQCPGTSQLMGATSPVTLAGGVVLWLSEALMSLVVLQLYKPGSPTFLSGNFGTFDMKTSVSAVASPEVSMCLAAQAQMGQRLGLPTWGLAGASDSMIVDGQAGAESAFGILAQGLAGLNLIHDVGYLGAGMVCSPEMLVMGDEICGMTRHFLKGITINAETLATEVIDKVGPGGNFIPEVHTFRHFRKETWFPTIMDRSHLHNWVSKGKPDINHRVREKINHLMANHKPVPLGDHEISEIERIRSEGEKALMKDK